MCGIFGYVGHRDATPLVLDGLSRIAYRGYDSAGIAVIDSAGALAVRKAAGKLDNLLDLVRRDPLSGNLGLGHTRWATHGPPTEVNAHPHLDSSGGVAVIHNGIIENHRELRARLLADGHAFSSATDTEVIPHLIEHYLLTGLSFVESVRRAAGELRGAHAVACMHTQSPDVLVTLRIGNAGGVAVGYGAGEMFVASDLPAMVSHTSTIRPLEPGELAVVHAEGCDVTTLAGERVNARKQTVNITPIAAAKGGHRHFMLKEIMEQPEAAMSALRGRLEFAPEDVVLDEIPLSDRELRELGRVVFVGMGTTLHACMVGARLTELLARVPATAENASEFRYRDPVVDEHTLVVGVTQSGETADTLEAMHRGAEAGGRVLAITNTAGSQASRQAEGTILLHSGPEISVASSKTFVNSMVAMYLLAVRLGAARGALGAAEHRRFPSLASGRGDHSAAQRARDQRRVLQDVRQFDGGDVPVGGAARRGARLGAADVAEHVETLSRLPGLLGEALDLNAGAFPSLATAYAKARRFLFLGRGLLEPIAREGALKLKELSYIHAEGMPAAEMKHGPIALIDGDTPVVALMLRDALYDKMASNVSEVRARSGKVIGIVTAGDTDAAGLVDDVIYAPPCPPTLAPMVAAAAVQLFAYHMAVLLGNDVDQPRNLAKSVTVE